MNKSKETINVLIKRKGLKEILNKNGINRVDPQAIFIIQNKINKDVEFFTKKLKQNLEINGKKELKEKDILEFLKKLTENQDFDY